MSFKILIPYYTGSPYTILEIDEVAGLNTRDKALSRVFDECGSLQNILLIGRGMEKRSGSATYGASQTGSKVVGLGFMEQDSGITALMTVNQTLYQYTAGAWVASDKTNYSANLDTCITTFTTKSGSSLDSGTSTSLTTNYLIEDSTKSWTPGAHIGRCVVIQGEVKYITDNTATILFLSDKLNSDTNADYQTKAYTIFAVAPHAFIGNGTDYVQKYNLTTTTAIDGTQVTSGKALPYAKWLSAHQGRLAMSTGTGNNNDKIYLSDIGIGENITVDTNLNVNTQFFNDGDQVNAHASLSLDIGSLLIVVKDHSIHAIEGDNILNYASRLISKDLGGIAAKTLAIYGQTAFVLSDKGVMAFSAKDNLLLNDPLPISRSIQPDIDAMTTAQKTNACAAVFNNRYYLQVGTKAWYYDIEGSLKQGQHVWADLNFPYNFNILTVINQALYGGDQVSGQAYQLLTGVTDGGTKISMVYESGDISLSDLKQFDKRIGGRPILWIERVEIMAMKDSATMLRFQSSIDGAPYGSVTSFTLNNDNMRYAFNIQQKGYSFKFKITENGSNAPVRIMFPIRVIFQTSEFGEGGTKG